MAIRQWETAMPMVYRLSFAAKYPIFSVGVASHGESLTPDFY
ncbi:hypothetical protein [Chamaesiphon sp. OTE_8_metabat_110]|nr:hypothetical protein [Chamaesiphon sp. OTE_8_metabat_110]